MPTPPAREVRRAKRIATRKQASIVVNVGSRLVRVPCLILDTSPHGFRLRTSSQLRRGQFVEVISNEIFDALPCRVMWAGKKGSKQEGEAGLQTVASLIFEADQHQEP